MNKKLSNHTIAVVNILNDGGYHDGTTIGNQLALSRTAIWKVIKKLERYGVNLNSVKGKGYALLEPLVLLDPAKIRQLSKQPTLDLTIFESVDSTNDYLKSTKATSSIQFCVAEEQLHGKGRMNREWLSPFGKNLYFSCAYPFQKDISELSGLSLVISLTVAKVLKEIGVYEYLGVKWPNDVLYAGHKLSGSLIEVQAESHGFCRAVVGVGINVNMHHDQDRISQSWASVAQLLGRYINRNQLCALLIDHLHADLARFNRYGFADFVDEWDELDYLKDKLIAVNHVDEVVTGKVCGVNEQGYLRLQLADGKMRIFSSGDTSIVKKQTI